MRRSKSPRSECELFRDIAQSIEDVGNFLGNMSFDDFISDKKTVRAVERSFQVLTEAAIRLGEAAPRLCPSQEWGHIRGFGNVLRHAYDSVDVEELWASAKQDLPKLYVAVRDVLQHMNDA